MSLTAADLAFLVSAELFGPADRSITGAAALEDAGPEDLSFVADARQLSRMGKCRAGTLLVPAAHAAALSAAAPAVTMLGVAEPQRTFQELLPRFRNVRPRPAQGDFAARFHQSDGHRWPRLLCRTRSGDRRRRGGRAGLRHSSRGGDRSRLPPGGERHAPSECRAVSRRPDRRGPFCMPPR